MGFGLLGFGCGYLLHRTEKNVYGYMMLAFLIIAAIDMGLGMYASEHPGRALPVKKVLVCTLILGAGSALTGLCMGVLSTRGDSGGWKPVGSGLIDFLPLLASVIVCIWYWQR